MGFLLLGAIAFLSSQKKDPDTSSQDSTAPSKSVDTFIPRGTVLVPLELANAESLSSLVGDMGGVVDLYLAANETRKGGLKVGSKLKLLRAPLNPQQYAVLVKDSESTRLLSYSGPFIAVVQNPDERSTGIAQEKRKSVSIDYQN
ncbi:MAG: hypothetical protein J7501_10000 [Bdellovibrio sp.]|nr:hypothetical protein [Bdellovibrio sp.]